jgi:hypothetical protein
LTSATTDPRGHNRTYRHDIARGRKKRRERSSRQPGSRRNEWPFVTKLAVTKLAVTNDQRERIVKAMAAEVSLRRREERESVRERNKKLAVTRRKKKRESDLGTG